MCTKTYAMHMAIMGPFLLLSNAVRLSLGNMVCVCWHDVNTDCSIVSLATSYEVMYVMYIHDTCVYRHVKT